MKCNHCMAVITLKFSLPCGTGDRLVRRSCLQPAPFPSGLSMYGCALCYSLLATQAIYASGLLEGSGTAASIFAGGHPSGAAPIKMAHWLQTDVKIDK